MFKKMEDLLKALKAQATLPTIKSPEVKLPQVKSQLKAPGIQQGSKKNPLKVAEQTQNKDVKDIKMKEAQDHLKINKSTGQWKL